MSPLFWLVWLLTWSMYTAVPSYVAPEVGIAFESQEVAVHSMTDTYTTLVYHIPRSPSHYSASSCGWVQFNASYDILSAPLWDLLRGYESLTIARVCKASPLVCGLPHPSGRNPGGLPRKKRFLGLVGTITGMVGVGMAVRNSAHLNELASTMDTVKKNQIKISKFVDNLAGETKFELHKVERMLLARSDETRHRIDKLNDAICGFNRDYALSFLQLSSRLMIDEAYDIVERAQSGEIDPRMISLSAIGDLTSAGGPLENTIYATDPGLFYALTTPYLVGLDSGKGLLYYTLQTPHIGMEDISPIYRIFNFGYQDNQTNSYYKISTPSHFYMLTDPYLPKASSNIPVPIDPVRCREKGPFMMCRHEVPEITNQSACLQALITATPTAKCTVVKLPAAVPKILHATRTAVLIRGETQVTLTDLVHGIPSNRMKDLPRDILTSIAYQDFSILSTAGHTIVSPSSPRGTSRGSLTPPITTDLVHLDFNPSHLHDETVTMTEDSSSLTSWLERGSLQSQLDTVVISHSRATWSVALVILLGCVGLSACGWLIWTRWRSIVVKKRNIQDALSKLLGTSQHKQQQMSSDVDGQLNPVATTD